MKILKLDNRTVVIAVIKPGNAYTGPPALIQAKVRSADALGITLDIIGAILLFLALLSVVISMVKR